MKKEKVLLLVCDGLGYREEKEFNAIAAAKTPNLDRFYKDCPFALLSASGEEIGLPKGQMGTSEANHLVIGAGRVIYQNLAKINKAVETETLGENEVLQKVFEHIRMHRSALHIKGILSDGGVHGHIDHIKSIVKEARKYGVKKIAIHAFTDGRDVAPKSALGFVDDLEKFLVKEGVGKIVTLGGRYWGMDRDENDDRIEKHFEVIAKGNGPRFSSAREAIEHGYNLGVTDEFLEPAIIQTENIEEDIIKPNDGVIFANFRSDRAKQMARRFIKENFENLKYVSMTKYEDDLEVAAVFPPDSIDHTLSEVISSSGLKQLKVTETEKFTHLTFFFNAHKYEAEPGEERILIESNKDVATHDQKPEMKIKEITSELIAAIEKDKFDFIAANITNCDMVGHSGNFDAIVKAVEYVDEALGRIVASAQQKGYAVIITADHGNAEQTFDKNSNQAMTSHTLNPVPFILISDSYKNLSATKGDLSDVAPTILKILGLDVPKQMTGKILV